MISNYRIIVKETSNPALVLMFSNSIEKMRGKKGFAHPDVVTG